jgi:hypothetical protein
MDQSTLLQHSASFNSPEVSRDTPPTTENESDERGTPPGLIEGLLNTNNGLFEVDLAAGAETTAIGDIKLDKETNALNCSWSPSDHPERKTDTDTPVTSGSGWLNPPFSRELIKKFARKLNVELSKDSLDYIIFLCSAQSISNEWFTENVMPHVSHICIPERRITFTDEDGNQMGEPQFPSLLFGLGDTPPQFTGFFNQIGTCLEIVEDDTVVEDLYEFISGSVHQNEDNPGLISTDYKKDEPILNNVGRGSQLELEIGDSMVGYPDTKLLNTTVTTVVETWSDDGDSWTVTTNLKQEHSPYNEAGYVIISVQKDNPSSFRVSYQVGKEMRWKPLPVTDIKTVSEKIEW